MLPHPISTAMVWDPIHLIASQVCVPLRYQTPHHLPPFVVKKCTLTFGASINVNSKQYEGKYRSAMYAAVKAANPNWQPGQPFDSSILDSVTRELVESNLVQSGNQFVRKSIDYSV